MSDFNETVINNPLPPLSEPPKDNRTRNIILGVAGAFLVFCCCCVVFVVLAWNYGDQILSGFGM